MKLLLSTIIIGLILVYVMGAAFRIDNLNLEMLVHNTVRFATGFVFLGIWVGYKRRLKLKLALYIVLALLVADDIVDYFRNINNLRLEMVIHDSFIVVWGAITGFLTMRKFYRKTSS